MPKIKTLKYDLFSATERDHWKNLEINIDAICDKWENRYKAELIKEMEKIPDDLLKQVIQLGKLKYNSHHSLSECILSDQRTSIVFLSLIYFAKTNPKSISRLFNITINRNKINKPAVLKKIIEGYKYNGLPGIFISLLKVKRGKGFFKFYFENKILKNEYSPYTKWFELLVRFLKRHDNENKIYHYRSSVETESGWTFLLLKETTDDIYPAIPNNVRILRGRYLLININLIEKELSIDTQSQKEAYRIKDYLTRKSKNKLRYSRVTAVYTASDFLTELKKEKDTKQELVLTEVEFRDSIIKSAIKVYDRLHKNDIFLQLTILKEKNILRLEDFSEFKNLTFNYKGLAFRLNVEETSWGQIRLTINDRNKPSKEATDFKDKFLCL